MKGKVSLYYNKIKIGLQLGYNQLHHPLHLGSTQYKQFPLKKKKKTKEKDRMKGRRRKGKRSKGKKWKGRRRKGKRWKRGEDKKGWKEFIRKERERENERWKKK